METPRRQASPPSRSSSRIAKRGLSVIDKKTDKARVLELFRSFFLDAKDPGTAAGRALQSDKQDLFRTYRQAVVDVVESEDAETLLYSDAHFTQALNALNAFPLRSSRPKRRRLDAGGGRSEISDEGSGGSSDSSSSDSGAASDRGRRSSRRRVYVGVRLKAAPDVDGFGQRLRLLLGELDAEDAERRSRQRRRGEGQRQLRAQLRVERSRTQALGSARDALQRELQRAQQDRDAAKSELEGLKAEKENREAEDMAAAQQLQELMLAEGGD